MSKLDINRRELPIGSVAYYVKRRHNGRNTENGFCQEIVYRVLK